MSVWVGTGKMLIMYFSRGSEAFRTKNKKQKQTSVTDFWTDRMIGRLTDRRTERPIVVIPVVGEFSRAIRDYQSTVS